MAAFEMLIGSSPPSRSAVILGGGDQMHSNNNENVTPKSKNPLDVDGRYDKVLDYTCRLFVQMMGPFMQRYVMRHRPAQNFGSALGAQSCQL